MLNLVFAAAAHWERIVAPDPLPEPRQSHSAFYTSVADPVSGSTLRVMLVVGGHPNAVTKTEVLSSAWAFDLDSRVWIRITSLLSLNIAQAAAAGTPAGSFLVIGTGLQGEQEGAVISNRFFELSLAPASGAKSILSAPAGSTAAIAPTPANVEEEPPGPTSSRPSAGTPEGAFENALSYYLKSKDACAAHRTRIAAAQATLDEADNEYILQVSPLLEKQPENESAASNWINSASEISSELERRRLFATTKLESVRTALLELDKAELQMSTLRRVNSTLVQQFSVLRASKASLDAIRSRLRDSRSSFSGLAKEEEDILHQLAELHLLGVADEEHTDRTQRQFVLTFQTRT